LLNYVSDKIIILTPEGIKTVSSVAEYVESIKTESGFSNKNTKNKVKKVNYEQQKLIKNKIKKIERELEAAEKKYHELEKEKKAIERNMNSPLYANNYQKLHAFGERQVEIETELLELLESMEKSEKEKDELLQGEKNDKD
jgi:dihydroorotate dehydrogenase